MHARYRTYVYPKAGRHPNFDRSIISLQPSPNYMEPANKIVQQKIADALEDFFSGESLRGEPERCSRCGAAMQYRTATFWLYGTDSAWNMRVPTCTCASPTSPVSH
jgi:hypothetical protein